MPLPLDINVILHLMAVMWNLWLIITYLTTKSYFMVNPLEMKCNWPSFECSWINKNFCWCNGFTCLLVSNWSNCVINTFLPATWRIIRHCMNAFNDILVYLLWNSCWYNTRRNQHFKSLCCCTQLIPYDTRPLNL